MFLRIPLFLLFNFAVNSFAQPFGNIGTFIDVNNVNAKIYPGGDLFWDLMGSALYEVPKGSGVHSIFAGALWIGGIDQAGQLHVSAHTYRQSGLDFWPGPVMSSGSYSLQQDTIWNRVWKINKSTIDSFISGQFTFIPQVILDWPGNGNTTLGQAPHLAPFHDNNGNGLYEPVFGDYPVIYGDQEVFFIYNDDRGVHTKTGGDKLGVEIHGHAYAYDCPGDSALWHTLFFRYNIFNRSAHSYDNVKLGVFTDFDLGNYLDDFLGCDTLLDLYYCYNGNDTDSWSSVGSYGPSPPAMGVTFLNHRMESFRFLYHDFTSAGFPVIHWHYYLYMNSLWKDSTHITEGGNGFHGVIPTNYFFSGDPISLSGWNEISSGNEPNDRRGLGTMAFGTFQPGEMKTVDIAYVFGRDYNGTNLTSLTELRQRVQTIQSYYQNGTTPCGSMPPISVGEVGFENAELNLYPNPAMDFLTIRMNIDDDASYEMFNILGESIAVGKLVGGRADISLPGVANGVYVVRVKTQRGMVSRLFVKS